MKKLMTGNEAVARGAYEAGVKFASAYPGTPSTEILENIALYKEDIKAEWAPNEKVAVESAAGASIAGARTVASMKHVGLNVAADPLFTIAYTGVNGGFVIITADEPGQHSSQNEQDNRNYAKSAKIPMLEPSDSQEAKDMIKKAFEISEKYDTPVLYRLTTRLCHSKSIVECNERKEVGIKEYVKDKNIAVDATLGNGYDCDFLSSCFKKVYAFEIQKEACEKYIDKNNNVILVGNPMQNKRIEEMFYKIVEEKLGKPQ